MKLKKIGLIALAAFAMGLGFTFNAGAASCYQCHAACEARYETCLASGTNAMTCWSRYLSCARGCGCPIP